VGTAPENADTDAPFGLGKLGRQAVWFSTPHIRSALSHVPIIRRVDRCGFVNVAGEVVMNILQDPRSASGPDTGALAADRPAGSFIVNLSALSEPAVPQPPPTDLQGLRSFVSRRTKDGIHRFYLHVGFFQTSSDAQEWLSTVRTRYPNAFVSKLAETLRPSEPGAPLVADTQVMKVLDVRAPQLDNESNETGSYVVQSEARILGTPPPASGVIWPMPSSSPQATPVKPPATAALQKAPRDADAWSTFMASDSSRTTGVRHLHVEIQRPRNSPLRPSKTRR
jgi:hypothetical protein